MAEEVLELVDLAAEVLEVEDLGEVATEDMEGPVESTQEWDRKPRKEVQGVLSYLLQEGEEPDTEALEHL